MGVVAVSTCSRHMAGCCPSHLPNLSVVVTDATCSPYANGNTTSSSLMSHKLFQVLVEGRQVPSLLTNNFVDKDVGSVAVVDVSSYLSSSPRYRYNSSQLLIQFSKNRCREGSTEYRCWSGPSLPILFPASNKLSVDHKKLALHKLPGRVAFFSPSAGTNMTREKPSTLTYQFIKLLDWYHQRHELRISSLIRAFKQEANLKK